MGKFDLKAAAVEHDTLRHPKIASEALVLMRKLDQVNAEIVRMPAMHRMAYLLSEVKVSDALLMHLRLKIESTERLRDAIEASRIRRARDEREMLEALRDVSAQVGNEYRRLVDLKQGLESQKGTDERRRMAAIETLIEAGLTPEEAASRAKPSEADLEAHRGELAAIPSALASLKHQMHSRVQQVQIL